MAKSQESKSGHKQEEEFLDKVLFELHMNYVDELKRPAEDDKAAGEETGEEAADEAPESKGGADEADEAKGEDKGEEKTKNEKGGKK